jgi:hypothetical protein
MSQPTNCNHDPKHQVFYDGALGYEAIVCRECGAYCDHSGAYPPDEWSLHYIKCFRPDTIECPVPPCPEGVPYDNHLVDCNCD